MHELSIAMSIIELAQEESDRRGGVPVSAVHLKLGALSGVVKEALLGSFEMACEDTPLKGARLVVEDVPVLIYCQNCQSPRPISSVQLFCCRNVALHRPTWCKERNSKWLHWRLKNGITTPF